MSQKISLVIHSVVSSICTSTQGQNTYFMSGKSRNITLTELEAAISYIVKFTASQAATYGGVCSLSGRFQRLTFPNQNMNELRRFQRREAQASTLWCHWKPLHGG